jgi:hypothetical protein
MMSNPIIIVEAMFVVAQQWAMTDDSDKRPIMRQSYEERR